MKQTQIRCNNCGAQITIQDGVDKMFCQYCGNQIILEDENKTTTHQIIDENRNINNRYYDEAKIKELEFDREERLAAQQKEELQNKEKRQTDMVLLGVWLVSLLVFIIASFFTLDNVNFSPFHIFIIIDLIVGFTVIKKRSNKLYAILS